MARQHPEGWRRVAAWVLGALLLLAAAASLVPLLETNRWFVRLLDFPRLQLATLTLLLLVAFLVARGRLGWSGAAVMALGLLGLSSHVVQLYPYLGLGVVPARAMTLTECRPDRNLTVMVANVQESNETADAFLAIAVDADPDVLLVMETDAFWDDRLGPLRERFGEVEQFIPEEDGAYGMHLFSRRPLVAPEMRFLFDRFTPTVVTGVELGDGSVVQFIGMHPQPPFFWSQPSTLRDAHLLAAGLEARASEAPTIVGGDLNAVPWERTTRRAARIGGLLDPRIGRGFYPTIGAESAWVSWPLDQVLYEPALALVRLEVLPAFGSDHYPMLATLCLAPEAAERQTPVPIRDDDLAEAEISIEAARSLTSEGSGSDR